ncbi:MAG: hypothetical protein R3E79_51960 [Caldilineaceae bacterium]
MTRAVTAGQAQELRQVIGDIRQQMLGIIQEQEEVLVAQIR